MGIPIRIDEELYNEAKSTAAAEYRSISSQIGFWARVGKTALDNPDLPVELIRDILIAKAMDHSVAEPFEPSDNK
ncbi:MAG: hypothetical protein DRJ08_02190 [Acidobacteria bacterium]|nr:hypothetical protein [Acidobacteriota bacterium]RLE17307.1 MAG: hypothetical protein DRJ14_06775 [Acidobacteriota bacterium]RLE23666.1 MAG: hypothetical protein DRJ08_02190 [Acidobacteriota bacterium]